MINGKLVSPFDNITFDYSVDPREFLGKDIDAGFRLKEYPQDRRLCISIELAYFLVHGGKRNNLHIMNYTRLKGVWNRDLYPIIWYYNAEIVCNCQQEMAGHGEPVGFAKVLAVNEAGYREVLSATEGMKADKASWANFSASASSSSFSVSSQCRELIF